MGFALAASGCVIEVPPAEVIAEDLPPVTVTVDPLAPDQGDDQQEAITWETFDDDRIPHSFEVPSSWEVLPGGDWAGGGIYLFEVFNEDGEMVIQYYSWLDRTGISCGDSPAQMKVEEVFSEPVSIKEGESAADSTVRFVYRIAHAEGHPYLGSLALATGDKELGGSCAYDNMAELGDEHGPGVFADVVRVNIINREEGQHEFDSFEEAEAFMETKEYQTLKRVLTSLRLK